MVDVDLCSRYAEHGICYNSAEYAKNIFDLEEDRKNIIFRSKEVSEVQRMLEHFSETIKQKISEKYNFDCRDLVPSSSNNKDGADVYTTLPSGELIIVELKFGSFTDKAAGMESFAKIFGTNVFSAAFSLKNRNKRVTLLENEFPNLEPHYLRMRRILNSTVKKFNQDMSRKSNILNCAEQEYLEEYLLNHSGSFEVKSDFYIRFETKKNGSELIESIPIEKGSGEWMVEPVEKLSRNTENLRINIIVNNLVSGVKIIFTLNNKNNFKLGETKIPSRMLVGSPSWNVWVHGMAAHEILDEKFKPRLCPIRKLFHIHE